MDSPWTVRRTVTVTIRCNQYHNHNQYQYHIPLPFSPLNRGENKGAPRPRAPPEVKL